MNTHETKISNTRASDTIAYDEKMDNRERWPAARQQFLCYLKLPPSFVGLFQGALFSFHLVEVSSAQRVRVHAHGLGDVVHDRLRDEHTLQFSANQANNTIAMQNTKQCNVMQARFPNKCSVRIWHNYICMFRDGSRLYTPEPAPRSETRRSAASNEQKNAGYWGFQTTFLYLPPTKAAVCGEV